MPLKGKVPFLLLLAGLLGRSIICYQIISNTGGPFSRTVFQLWDSCDDTQPYNPPILVFNFVNGRLKHPPKTEAEEDAKNLILTR